MCSFTGFSGEQWYRIAYKNADKLTALRALADRLGIPLAQVAAFGDDWIDAPMLQACGFGVVMDNAPEEIKNTVHFQTDSNDHDGVANWLEENILQVTGSKNSL